MTDDEQLWEPTPVSEAKFLGEDGHANINRAPPDRISGVIYKRSVSIKRVLYHLADPAVITPAVITPAVDIPTESALVADMMMPWQGHGDAEVRWLFSEQSGTAEGLLSGRLFSFLQELELAVGSATGHRGYTDRDTVLYVVAGCGVLYHRPSSGSPIVARPLRVGDVALIVAGELYSVCNESESELLRLLVLGLSVVESAGVGGVDG